MKEKLRVLVVGAAFSADLHMDGYSRILDKVEIAAIAQMSEENSVAVASVAGTARNLVGVSDTLRASVASFRV